MVWWHRFSYKLLNFIRPSRAERELAREIALHVQLLEEDFQSRGMVASFLYAVKRLIRGLCQERSRRLQLSLYLQDICRHGEHHAWIR